MRRATLFVTFLLALPLAGCGGNDRPAQPVGAAPAVNRPDISGVWSTTQTIAGNFEPTPELPIEDHLEFCYSCTVESYEYIKAWLADPANDGRPSEELDKMFPKTGAGDNQIPDDMLQPAAVKYRKEFKGAEDDPSLKCVPFSYARLHYDDLLPQKIEQFADRVVITKEYWQTAQTIYTDGRGFPADLKPSASGYSIGWYEGQTFVVVTGGLAAALLTDDGVQLSDAARVVERYTREGKRLHVVLTILDPQTFRRPAVFVKTWLPTPGVELQDFPCERPQ